MSRFFGVGRAFTKSYDGIPERKEDEDLVKDSIFQIITTKIGERVMRPAYGSRVIDFVFESKGTFLRSFIDREVRRSIGGLERRARVLNVTVDDSDSEVVSIKIDYAVLNLTESVTIELPTNN